MAPPKFPFAREEAYYPSQLNAELRHKAPVSKVKLYNGEEAWIVTKHKDICTALTSDKLSADRRTPGYPEIHEGGHKAKDARPTFVNLDSPQHAEQRAMLESSFTPEAVEKLRPMIQEVVDAALDDLVVRYNENDKISVDLIEHFASPVPTQIVYKILGVPDKDIASLSQHSEVRTGTSRDAAEKANGSLERYMRDLVKSRISNPQNDLISKMVVEQYQPGRLSEDDVVNLAFLVLTAGNAALINSIGLGVLTLFQHLNQLQTFVKDTSLGPRVVNELLRYNTASALNSRRAANDNVEIGGQNIRKGEGVICSVQSGDRDEEKTLEPEKFDIYREYDPKDVLGFGYGPHRCQGEALSRLELEIALASLFKRWPALRLAESSKEVGELKYTPQMQNMGVMELLVKL